MIPCLNNLLTLAIWSVLKLLWVENEDGPDGVAAMGLGGIQEVNVDSHRYTHICIYIYIYIYISRSNCLMHRPVVEGIMVGAPWSHVQTHS